ncbi:MAG: hypothetical protein HC824_20995 [Synechococcales cyanobacterium RM1_1_8]|nr:hypothetical protein [Synechococcales cyanobacterium RM1_1_8]
MGNKAELNALLSVPWMAIAPHPSPIMLLGTTELPNGANRAPDAAWVRRDRWNAC